MKPAATSDMPPRFALGHHIWYLHNNRVCCAPVLSMMEVRNAHPEFASTEAQRHIYEHFGLAGVYYATTHGVVAAADAYESREEMAAAMLTS